MNEEPISQEEKVPFDAGDPGHVRKRKRDASKKDVQRIDTLKEMMSVRQGRAWVWWLLEQCGVRRTSISSDPYRTYFNEGQRNIGLMILADLHEHCAGDYQRMVLEDQQVQEIRNVPT